MIYCCYFCVCVTLSPPPPHSSFLKKVGAVFDEHMMRMCTLRRRTQQHHPPRSAHFSKDGGKLLVLFTWTLEVYDLAAADADHMAEVVYVVAFNSHAFDFKTVAWAPDGLRIAAFSKDFVSVLSLARDPVAALDREPISEHSFRIKGDLIAPASLTGAWTSDGRHMWCLQDNASKLRLELRRASDWELCRVVVAEAIPSPAPVLVPFFPGLPIGIPHWELALSPDGGSVLVWDDATPVVHVVSLAAPTLDYASVKVGPEGLCHAWSADGSLLAIGSDTGVNATYAMRICKYRLNKGFRVVLLDVGRDPRHVDPAVHGRSMATLLPDRRDRPRHRAQHSQCAPNP